LDRNNIPVEQEQLYSDFNLSVDDAIRLFIEKYQYGNPGAVFHLCWIRDYSKDYCELMGIKRDWTFFFPTSINQWLQYLVDKQHFTQYHKDAARKTINKFLQWCVTNKSFYEVAIKAVA
jgi:hypothetical protein